MQPLHRLLSGKYYIDELYEALIAVPIRWISDRVFLAHCDRLLLDGTLNGMASVARGAAGQLARVQTGNLHFYAFLVLAGLVALLLWSWAMSEPAVLNLILFLPVIGMALLPLARAVTAWCAR